MSTRADRLIAIRTNIETVIETQTEEWLAQGCPPTLSIDGESYQWDSWLSTKLAAIETLDKLIQHARPYYLRSRHRG